ncbi:ankyrin repeat-containing protein [Tanacetum coccineum]
MAVEEAHEQQEPFESWEQLKEELLDWFQFHTKGDLHQQILSIVQTETVREFRSLFEKLAGHLTTISEKVLQHYYSSMASSSATTKTMTNNNNNAKTPPPSTKTGAVGARSKTPVSRRSVTPTSRSHTRQTEDDADPDGGASLSSVRAITLHNLAEKGNLSNNAKGNGNFRIPQKVEQ